MTGFADPTDPDEFRRQFPELAGLAPTIPLAAVLDAVQAGHAHLASYTNRTTSLRPAKGQSVTGLVSDVVDEVLEAVTCRLLAAYTTPAP